MRNNSSGRRRSPRFLAVSMVMTLFGFARMEVKVRYGPDGKHRRD